MEQIHFQRDTIDLKLSPLGHTWLIDLDGTMVVQNGHQTGKGDSILPGVKSFIRNIPVDDFIIILTARGQEFMESTVNFLREHDIRFDRIICGLPTGERIIINDVKPSGLATALCVNLRRNSGMDNLAIVIDKSM